MMPDMRTNKYSAPVQEHASDTEHRIQKKSELCQRFLFHNDCLESRKVQFPRDAFGSIFNSEIVFLLIKILV
jgi:hypothetical protein